MDKATFYSTKSALPEYEAITFTHPAFAAPIRLVANQFQPVTLGGNVHTPCPMTIAPPEAPGATRLTLVFPRAVVGRQFKQQLALTAGSRAPIEIKYEVYCGAVDVPEKVWNLYAGDAGGIQFSTEAVQVVATVDNPMRRAVARIYDPAIFTGLEIL